MKEILLDYLKIYQFFPVNNTWGKLKRRERHTMLMQWQANSYSEIPDIQEVIFFLKSYTDLAYEWPFFSKVLVPCVDKDLENNKVDAIRFLLENCANKHLNNYKDYLYILSDAANWKYSPYSLVELLLENEPDNEPALQYKYEMMQKSITLTIHEVPWVVLNGMYAAQKSAIPAMINDLNTFEQLCKKLNKEQQKFIELCRSLYLAWSNYLDDIGNYNGFEEYLKQNNVRLC